MKIDTLAIKEIVLEQHQMVLALYLFGSYAAGLADENSDVDIGIISKSALSPESRYTLQELIARKLQKNVDLVDLSTCSTIMAMEVITSGQVFLAEDADAVAQFENVVAGKYWRFMQSRQGIVDDIVKVGSVYGKKNR